MSLAQMRATFGIPARVGAPVTVKVHDHSPAYHATITGSQGDWIKVQNNHDHTVHAVTWEDLTFH